MGISAVVIALLALLASATAAVNVTATIESFATVEIDGECALLTTNDPDAAAYLNDRELVADVWTCPADPLPERLVGIPLLRIRAS